MLPEEALIEREVNRSGAHPVASVDKPDSKRNIIANGSQRSLAVAGHAETTDIETGLPPRKVRTSFCEVCPSESAITAVRSSLRFGFTTISPELLSYVNQ